MSEKHSITDRIGFLAGTAAATWGTMIGTVQILVGQDPKTAFAIAAAGGMGAVATAVFTNTYEKKDPERPLVLDYSQSHPSLFQSFLHRRENHYN